MFTKRQKRNVLVVLSSIFTLSVLLTIFSVYLENFPAIVGYTSNKAAKESDSDRYHTVKYGETLEDISKKYYGSPRYIETIYESNQPLIHNRLILETGLSLIIPFSP